MPQIIDLSSPTEVGLSAFQAGHALPMAPGLFYTAPAPGRSTLVPTNNVVRAKRITVSRPCVITSLAFEVVVAGATNSLLRLGMYSWNLDRPQSLLVDTGTSLTSVVGVKTVAVNVPVNAGDNILLAVVYQGNTTTLPTLRSYSGDIDPQLGTSAANALGTSPKCLLATTNVSGGFPNELVWGAEDNSAVVVAVSAAA